MEKVQAPLGDSPSAVRRYGVAALCVTGAVLLRWLLDPVLGPYLPLATIFGFVGIAVWYGGWGPALFTAVMSYFVVHWLIIEPRYVFHFAARELWGLTLFAFSISVLICVGQFMRGARHRARLNAVAVTERQRQLEAEIVERKHAEQVLREREAELGLIVHRTPFLLTRCTRDFRYKYVSKAYADMLGLPAEDIVGKPIVEIMGEAGFQTILPYIVQVLAGHLVAFESDIPFKGRGIRSLQVHYAPEMDSEGNTIGWIASILDNTERNKVQGQLRETESRFRTMADTAPVLIWMADTTKLCTWFNKHWLAFTGRTLEQELGNGWTESVHSEDFTDCFNTYTSAFDARQPFRMEYRIRRHDGVYRWIEGNGVPRYAENGAFLGYIGSCIDVTERKELEGRLTHWNQELECRVMERTQQLENAQQGLRALAVELNLAEQRERKRLAGELHDYLAQLLILCRLNLGQLRRASLPEKVDATLQDTEEVLNQALNFSRTLMAELSPPVLQEHGLPAGLKWLAEQMQRRGLTVVVDDAGAGEFVLSENLAVLLYQSVRELLTNVLKHANCTEAAVQLQKENGHLRIDVYDEGGGCDFVGAPADYTVTAMSSKFGLYSIRERMKALGGWFEFASAPGKGTRATMVLPIEEQTMVSDARFGGGEGAPDSHHSLVKQIEHGEIVPLPHGSVQQHIRVLLVDDHAMVRQGLRSVLDQYANIEVVGEASDGEEAVAMATVLKPTIVLMDINMPKMNGIDATAALKVRFQNMIVIGLSVNAGGRNETAMIQAGAAMLLTKEAAVDELYQAIEQVLREPQQLNIERVREQLSDSPTDGRVLS